MTSPDDLATLVEAEEFAGGSMSVPMPDQQTKTGKVIFVSRPNGDWSADCTQCGAGCGAAGVSATGDEVDIDALDYEDQMLADFTAEHRDCRLPADPGEELPTPSLMPARTAGAATTWIVRGTNGSDLKIRAEWHTTYARPDGTELRFYNRDGDNQHRAATVRAGSWHWVVAESSIEPKGVDK